MSRWPLLLLLIAACQPAAPVEHLYGLYSIHNFADTQCRTVIYFNFASADTSLAGFDQLLPSDSIVERLYMGRYALHLRIEVYDASYVLGYVDTLTDSVDVPGTRTISFCRLP